MKKKFELSWDQVIYRLAPYDKRGEILYGVPKGGMILTAFLQEAQVTFDASRATLILDDIIDSGATKQKYHDKYPNTPFAAIVDKTLDESLDDYWIVFPWEKDHPGKQEDSAQDNIIRIFEYIGEDPDREGLLKTPDRVIKSWEEIYCGYNMNVGPMLTTFKNDGCDEIVLLKDIEMYSMCEHHMLPFFGKAHVAYIPKDKIVGISKLARLVDVFSRRLQIQERIGEQVTGALMEHLKPKGAACIIEATHMCMRMRGVGKQNSVMTTSSMKGVFLEKPAAREELMQLIKR